MICVTMRLVYRRLHTCATQSLAALLIGAAALTFPARIQAHYEPAMQGAFTAIGDQRYFEPDDGAPIPILLDIRGDTALGADASHAAARAAIETWSNLADTTLRFVDGGFTTDLSRTCPGPNKIIFDDPDGILPPPVPDPDVPGQCRGVLALGITRTSTFEFKSFADSDFARTRCGFVVVADGWGPCSNWNACNLAEAITHELGHLLGLAHSSERNDESDPLLRDAAMYFRAHFDGRCADIRSDDAAGVRFLYPTELPVTVTTGTPLAPAWLGLPFSQALSAVGGGGSFTWTLARGNATGISISSDGIVLGIPERVGNQFIVARATDAIGDRHDKVLDIFVATPLTPPPSPQPTDTPNPTASLTPSLTPTPEPSASPTASRTPPASTTPTPNATATSEASATTTPIPAPCLGDCDDSGSVSVDEILTAINIALGAIALGACPQADRNGDESVSVDELVAIVDAALRGCAAAVGSVPQSRLAHEAAEL